MPTDGAGSQDGTHGEYEFDSASWLWAATFLALRDDQNEFQRLLRAKIAMGKWEAAARELGLPNHHVQQCRVIDAVFDLTEQEAARLSRKTGLEVDRLRPILTRTAVPPPPITSDPVRQLELIRKHGLTFTPSLEDVLEFLPQDRAFELLEGNELYRVQRTLIHIEVLNLGHWPFYTLEELEQLLAEFIAYLERNRQHIVQTGFPEVSFERSLWFEAILGKTYYVKLPVKVEKREPGSPGETTPDAAGEDVVPAYVYEYKWSAEDDSTQNARDAGRGHYGRYEGASILPGLTGEDAHTLDGMRRKFFELKLQVLQILLQTLRDRHRIPSEECLQLLIGSLTAAEVQFYLRMDAFYIAESPDQRGIGVPLPSPGGLHNLLTFIWHVEEELNIGLFWRTRRRLGDLVDTDCLGRSVLSERQYLRTLDTPSSRVIDGALDEMGRLNERAVSDWEEFYGRVVGRFGERYREQADLDELMAMLSKHLPSLSSKIGDIEALHESLPERLAAAMRERVPTPTLEKEAADDVFRKEGDSWLVVYQGQGAEKRVGAYIGMYHIHELISNPGKQLTPTDLDSLLPEPDADIEPRQPKEVLKDALIQGDLVSCWEGNAEEAIDWRAKDDLGERQDRLLREAQEAEDVGNLADAVAMREEAEKIDEYLSKSTDLKGHPRKLRDAHKAAYNRVYSRLRTVYQKIQLAGHAPLAQHLRNAINYSHGRYSYTPETPIEWHT